MPKTKKRNKKVTHSNLPPKENNLPNPEVFLEELEELLQDQDDYKW